jgi:DUF4097 and DUF4098 domain-containing protein YvlB
MKKYLVFLFIFALALSLAACDMEEAVLEEVKSYEISGQIHSLDIRINAAALTIKTGNGFALESNLKNLTVSVNDGVLTVIEENKSALTHTNAMLTLQIPEMVFDSVKLTTGAAKLSADRLAAKTMELVLGAGDVYFGSLSAYKSIRMEGGAGKITVANGSLANLSLIMGVGKLELTAALSAKSNLEFGVGESILTLLGGKDAYTVEIQKGIGNITVDGKTVTDFGSSGNGRNRVKILGGVGNIRLTFRQ